jgi:ribosomal protein L37AE/L43A
MAAKAGERARETGDFRCTKCHQKTHVTKGKKIPKCENCGGSTF